MSAISSLVRIHRGSMRTSVAVVFMTIFLVPALVAAPDARAASPSPQASAGATAATGTTLRIGFPEAVDSLNPFATMSGIGWEVLTLGYSYLTTWDDHYRPVPDLAESWTTSADGKVWTFKIKPGVTWHDGVPVTAHDVAFTLNLIKKRQIASFATEVAPMKSIVALDGRTVVITCGQPYSGMLALDMPILPEHIWSKIPPDKLESWPNQPFVGSGPFKLADFKRNSQVRMVAYDGYEAGPRPTVDEVDLLTYQNPTSMVMDYQSGALDAITSFPAASYKKLVAMRSSKTVAGTFIGFEELGFNCWNSPQSKGNPLLLDQRIRQAIAWAIDKKQLVNQCMFGQPEPATSILSPIMPWHWQPPTGELVTFDPAKAKQILDAAGYVDRDGDGVREAPNGAKLSFRLTALNEYPELLSAAKLIHQWLSDIGIKIRIVTMSESSFYDVVYGSTDDDMYLWAWGGGPDPNLILSAFTTGQIKSWSDCNWSNKEYDRLFQAQTRAVSIEERKKIIDRMQQLLYESDPYIVLWYAVRPEAWRTDRFTGWRQVPPGTGVPLYNYTRLTYLDLRPASQRSGGGGHLPYWLIGVAGIVAVGAVIWRRTRPRPVETE